VFANTIAAVEAFKHSGYEKARTCFHDLKKAASDVYEANEQDNLRDDNLDGIADIDQIDKRQLLSRKITLLIRTVDPTVLQQAFIGLYQGFIGVLATLKFKFAKSIALGLSVGNMAKRPLAVLLTPTLKHVLKPGRYRSAHLLSIARCSSTAARFCLARSSASGWPLLSSSRRRPGMQTSDYCTLYDFGMSARGVGVAKMLLSASPCMWLYIQMTARSGRL
jgi:hypothetical protein